MFEEILLTISLIREAITQREMNQLFHEQVYFKRVVIPVTIDLSMLNDQLNPFQNSNFQFIELNYEDLRNRNLSFSVRSRYFKAMRNIKKGLRGFILLYDDTVISDIWCLVPRNLNTPIRHPDLDMLGITCDDRDIYALDMFIDPAYRGKKLAAPIHQSLQLTLKREGWRRIYAYYYEDNISSKWMHFMLKFKELPKLRVSRFFFLIKAHKYIPANPAI
jgi:GNAT superfamily N-acetyltransferase